MRAQQFLKQFNWRFLLVRIVVNGIALDVTAVLVPRITFVDPSIWNWLFMAIMLGILNALVKPVLQILTLPFLFVSYGLVIVVVNALILLLLSSLFPTRFAVDNLLWALVGGLVLGMLSSFLESLMGLTKPIVPDEPPELRRQVEEHAPQANWLVAASSDALSERQVLTMEPPAARAKAAGHAGAELAVAEPAAAEPAVAETTPPEASTPGPDDGPLPPVEDEEDRS